MLDGGDDDGEWSVDSNDRGMELLGVQNLMADSYDSKWWLVLVRIGSGDYFSSRIGDLFIYFWVLW